MNYFAHGRPFIDDPYFLAGTAVPDWLNVVDRKVRVRRRHALEHVEAIDPVVARVAAGIVQHCSDDDWFHGTRAFAELSLGLSRLVRDALGADEGFRPHFLGHILVELLLDAELVAEAPERLDAYYRAIDLLDVAAVERAVNQIAPRPARDLGRFIGLFSQERFLSDYTQDAKLLIRLNQVMRRVGLATLPDASVEWLAVARERVAERKAELLVA